MTKVTVLALTAFVGGVLMTADAGLGNQLTMGIRLNQDEFSLEEKVSGRVFIDSRIPATFPATFRIHVYKNNALVRHALYKTPVFPGKNEFPLEKFGVAQITASPENIGEWRILIIYSENPRIDCEARFSIIAVSRQTF